jgi:hypothetical protein
MSRLQRNASKIVRYFRRALLALFAAAMLRPLRPDSFRMIWRFVLAHPRFFQQLVRDPYRRQPWQNVVYVDCVRIMRRKYPGFRPGIKYGDVTPLLTAVERGDKIVFVGLHSEISTAFYRLFADYNLVFSVIAEPHIHKKTGRSSLERMAKRLGFDQPIDIIPHDENCFLLARKAMTSKRIICCAPDIALGPLARRIDRSPLAFPAEPAWPADLAWPPEADVRHRVVIKAGLFKFCQAVKASAFYSVPSIEADGTININLSGPHRSRSEDDVAAMIRSFMAYAEAVTGFARRWQISGLPGRTDGGRTGSSVQSTSSSASLLIS